MTLAEYSSYIGRSGTLLDVLPGLNVAITITDVRNAFGRVDVKVVPVSGNGETWVSVTRVILEDK
jgi:hypothetical protein